MNPNQTKFRGNRWETMSHLFHKQPVLVAFYIASTGILTERTEGRVCSGPHCSIVKGNRICSRKQKMNVDSLLIFSFLSTSETHPAFRVGSHSNLSRNTLTCTLKGVCSLRSLIKWTIKINHHPSSIWSFVFSCCLLTCVPMCIDATRNPVISSKS